MELQQRQPSHRKTSPRVIPQAVLRQLRVHRDSLPASIARMVTLLLESGMRLTELCSLPFDCLIQNEDGSWFLRYNDLKTRNECTILVSDEGVAAIREQQRTLENEQGGVKHYLFPNPKGQPFIPQNFINILNRLACERAICDDTGNVWRFRAHQFRFTFYSQMMRHRSPLSIQYCARPDMVKRACTHSFHLLDYDREKRLTQILSQTRQEGLVDSGELLSRMRSAFARGFDCCALPSIVGSCTRSFPCHFCGKYHFLD